MIVLVVNLIYCESIFQHEQLLIYALKSIHKGDQNNILLAYLLDSKIKNSETAEQVLGLPVLGIIPYFEDYGPLFNEINSSFFNEVKQSLLSITSLP